MFLVVTLTLVSLVGLTSPVLLTGLLALPFRVVAALMLLTTLLVLLTTLLVLLTLLRIHTINCLL